MSVLHADELYLSLLAGEERAMLLVLVAHPILVVSVTVEVSGKILGQLIVLVLVRILLHVELLHLLGIGLPQGRHLVGDVGLENPILLSDELSVA